MPTIQVIDESKQYSLSAVSVSASYITVDNTSNLILTNQPNDFYLLFHVTRGNDKSKWNFCTSIVPSQPSTARCCMDQWGDNLTSAAMQSFNYVAGQQWTLTGLVQSDGTTFWRMQNDFGGPGRYLTAVGRNVAMLSNSSDSATYWKLIEALSSASSSVIPSAATSSGVNAVTGVSTSTASVAANDASSPQTSVIGISVGVSLAVLVIVLLLLTAIMSIVSRRRKSRRMQSDACAEPEMCCSDQNSMRQPQQMSQYTTDAAPQIPPLKPLSHVHEIGVPARQNSNIGSSSEVPSLRTSRIQEMDGSRCIHELEAGPDR